MQPGQIGFRDVFDAGDGQLITVSIEDDAPVFERQQSQFGEARHPGVVTKNVLMITRDHVDAVSRVQVSKRLDVDATRIERAVDEIPRDRDQVHTELVGSRDDSTRLAWRGTAEAPPGSDHSWYASWAPSNDPRYVVVVLIEHGGFGAEAAAPAAKEIYSALFNVKAPPAKP